MQRPRRTSALIDALMAEVNKPCIGKGGDSYRCRRNQQLMLEAATVLAGWGRPAAIKTMRKAQAADLFAPKRDDAGLPL